MAVSNIESLIDAAFVDLRRNRPAREVLDSLACLRIADCPPAASARWHVARGIALNRLAHHEQAMAALSDAQAILACLGDHAGLSLAWQQIGVVHTWRGEAREAAFALGHALAEAAAAGSRSHTAMATLDLARVHLEIGRPNQAVVLLNLVLCDSGADLEEAEHRRAEVNLLQALNAAACTEQATALHEKLVRTPLPPRQRHLALLEGVHLRAARGDLAFAAEGLQAAADALSDDPLSYERTEWLFAKCEVDLAKGSGESVLADIDAVIGRCLSDDLVSREVRARKLRAKALEKVGRTDEASDELLVALRRATALGLVGFADDLRKILLERGEDSLALLELKQQGRRNEARVAARFVRRNFAGAGGQGSVTRAYDIESGSEVALKKIEIADTLDPARRAILLDAARREAIAASKVVHPGVARVLGLFLEPSGDAFVASEFVQGLTLRHVIEARLSHASIAVLVSRMAYALSALHQAGVVHADFKPENVIVRDGMWPVLIDFGSATLSGGRDNAAMLTYTNAYAAPEQIEGRAFDHRADLFALGVVAFELICGSRPLATESVFALPWSARSRITADLRARGLPDTQAAIVASCLAARPIWRPKSAAIVAERFSHIPKLNA